MYRGIWLAFFVCQLAPVQADDGAALRHFESAVRPVLVEHCAKCHGAQKQTHGLRVDLRTTLLNGGDSGPAIVPGKPDESLLLQKLISGEMPPKSEPRLTPGQIAAIRQWIAAGAPMLDRTADEKTFSITKADQHWSFQTPNREAALSSLPAEARHRLVSPGRIGQPIATASPGTLHPIDAFLDVKLAEKHLEATPSADKITLIRRAYFDLLGLPPTPEQVAKFVNDASPTAWESLITELLASPHYGERWARHWLDVARYADSGGYETDIYYRHAWRYRDYVVKSFNDDKPYNRYVQEQIAGDEIWPNNIDLDGSFQIPAEKKQALEAHVGTGFYALGPQIHESNMDGRLIHYERLTDWVDATGAAFLGMTFGCARCHDHKFDPFTQRDYYSLQAVFARSKEAERSIVSAMEIADYKQVYPHVLGVVAARDAYRQYEKTLAGRKPTPEEEHQKLELLQAIGQAVLKVPTTGGSTPNTPFDGLLESPTATVLEHERPGLVLPVYILKRGDLGQETERVSAGIPQFLANKMHVSHEVTESTNSRKELAEWLTRPDHPLTARVFVNRLWQWHFGRGIVATPSDFGAMGQPPTHPELLDWLTTEFMERDWRPKEMHYLIMTSAAYRRQSRVATPQQITVDPDNRLLWRFHRRRLEGEAVWDAIHAAAGTINLQIGGVPVMPPLSADELASMRERYRWIVSPDSKQHARRGLYIISFRNFRFPLFDIFDAPNNAVSTAQRDDSTVSSQALWLLNNQIIWQQAQHLAARILKEQQHTPEAFVGRLWQLTLGRVPTDTERHSALELMISLESSASLQSLVNCPEELAALPPGKALAMASLCLTMFNHNEFLFID